MVMQMLSSNQNQPLALIVRRERPRGQKRGGHLYLEAIVQELAAIGWRVRFLEQKERSLLERARRGLKHLFGRTGHERERGDGSIFAPMQADEIQRLGQSIAALRPRLLVANGTTLAPVLQAAPPGCLTAVLVHDVIANRDASYRRRGRSSPIRQETLRDELRLLAKADLVIAIQPDEAAWLREALGKEVVTALMPADLVRSWSGESRSCLYVGSGNERNRDGLLWLARQAWPHVLREVPDATLDVYGGVCDGIELDEPGVRLHGQVADLDAAYRRAALVTVPLLAGSGLKIKLVEALAHQRACVSTSTGVQGVADLVGGAVFVHDEPTAFAAAVVRLLQDGSHRHAAEQQAAGIVERFFTREHALAELKARLTPAALKDHPAEPAA